MDIIHSGAFLVLYLHVEQEWLPYTISLLEFGSCYPSFCSPSRFVHGLRILSDDYDICPMITILVLFVSILYEDTTFPCSNINFVLNFFVFFIVMQLRTTFGAVLIPGLKTILGFTTLGVSIGRTSTSRVRGWVIPKAIF